MSLDEVREIAKSMGLNPRRSQSVREISYAILDAQADNRAAVVQAKEEARAAAGKTGKRERVRGVQRAAKVNTSNLKSEQVLATVGSEKEELAQMQQQLKENNHRPNKTVQAVLPFAENVKVEEQESKVKSQESKVKSQELPVKSQEAKEEEAPKETPKKKRGRPKKSEEPKNNDTMSAAKPLNDAAAQPNDVPKPEEPKPEEPVFVLPNLGENVIAMGTLECAPDGYGFLRSADYN